MNVHDIAAGSTTLREVSLHILTHLLTQGVPAIAEYERHGESLTRCAYRGEDGKSCAIGCLLTDDDMTRVSEGMGAGEAVNAALEQLGGAPFSEDTYSFFDDAQTLHDAFYNNVSKRITPITIHTLLEQVEEMVFDESLDENSPLVQVARELGDVA